MFRLTLLLCLFSFTAQAQTLRGVVVDRSNNSAPISGVSITPLTGGDNAVVSNSAGIFTFSFPTVKPGQAIELLVQKEGYVILGPDETIFRLNMPEAGATVKIAVVKSEAFKNLKADYVSAIEKKLKAAEDERGKLIGQLSNEGLTDIERQSLNETISKQSKEISSLRGNKEDLAKRLAQIDLDEASNFARQALRKFQEEGDIKAALDMMTAEKNDAFWDSVLSQEEMVQRAREQGVENYMIRARLLAADLNFGEAKKSYLTALERDSTNFSNWFETAYFLQRQLDFQKATALYERTLELSETPGSRSRVLNNLANLYQDNQRMKEAEASYDESISIRRELVKTNRLVNLPGLAMSLNNLGVLYQDNKRMKEAEASYDEAVTIRRELVKTNRLANLPDLAMSLNNLGVLYRDNQRMKEAEASYDEAVIIRRELVKTNRLVYLPGLARSLSNLGVLYSANQRMKEAEASYDEAVVIYRELVKTNRLVYLPGLATTLKNLGVLYRGSQRMKEAEASYDEAVAICREIVKTNRLVYLPDLASSLNKLGVLYRGNQRMKEAEASYDEAVATYRELVKTNRLAYLQDLARSLNNLGILYHANQRMKEAEASYDEAVEINRELVKTNRLAYLPDLARILYNLGIFNESNDRFLEALTYYNESLSLYLEGMNGGFPGSVKGIERALRNLGDVKDSLYVRNDYDGVFKAVKIICNSWEELQKINKNYFPRAAQEKGNLAWYALFAKKYPEALTAAKEALTQDPTQTWINTNLALAHLFNNNRPEAKAIYQNLKDQPYPQDESKTFREIFLADLAELAAAGIVPKNVEEVKRWLE